MNPLSFFLILVVRAYQITLSPQKGFLRFLYASPIISLTGVPAGCRFSPSCSEYALMALAREPVGRAIRLIAKRVMSCHAL